MRIYFTFEPRPDLRDPLVAEFPHVDFIFETGLSIDELQRADVLVTYGEDLNNENMNYATNLKWIFVASAGIEKNACSSYYGTKYLSFKCTRYS